jgi:thiol-disulfide isomerase/thioredoxin
MHVLHIDSEKDVGKVDKLIKQGKDVFILVYMKGCGPCNATRPEWEMLETSLKDQYAKNDNLVIIDINKDYLSSIKHIGNVDGFPTIKYIGKRGTIVEPYEKGERSVSSFITWIESKINNVISTTQTSSPENVYKRLVRSEKHATKSKNKTIRKHSKTKTRHNKSKHRGGKWSKKYKDSINCSKPKGFSQKQHCKYGRKTVRKTNL